MNDSDDLIYGMTVAFLGEALVVVLIVLGLHLWGII